MLILTVNTNVPVDKVPCDFCGAATELIRSRLCKPGFLTAVHINPGQNLTFGGSDSPAAICDIVSAESPSSNIADSQVIMHFLQEKLDVPPSRAYITFKYVNGDGIGYDCSKIEQGKLTEQI